MSLLAELGLGEVVNVDQVEKEMEPSGLPPEGVHHAVLTGSGPIQNASPGGWKLKFKIIAPETNTYKEIEECLWKPDGKDAAKDKKKANRILTFACRLGWYKKDEKGNAQAVAGKHDFLDCLGTPCFIDVKHEDETFDGKKGKVTIKKAILNWMGILKADDEKVKGVATGKVPPLSTLTTATATGSTAAVANNNYADI